MMATGRKYASSSYSRHSQLQKRECQKSDPKPPRRCQYLSDGSGRTAALGKPAWVIGPLDSRR
jgi:hypothetical protein